MSTTTVSASARPVSSSLATSSKFKAFALVFGISFAVMYVICDLYALPLFSFHPATNRIAWGWEGPRSGEGPVMYWYGWVATCFLVAGALGLLATLLPESAVKKIPLMLVWLVPILALIPLFNSLMPFWTK
jgi:hypothetical protein